MSRILVQDEENWDDDFEFGGQSATNSPVQSIRRRSIPSPPHSPPRAHKHTKSRGNGINNLSLTTGTRTTRWSVDTGGLDDENWDEDEPTIPPVVQSWSVISNPLPSSTLATLAPLLPPPPLSIDSRQRRPMRASRLSNNVSVNPGKEEGDNRRLVDEFGLLSTGQDRTISVALPAQQPPHAPHSRNSTSSQHKHTPSVPLASNTSPNSPPSTNAWNSNDLELSSRPFPLPSASPPISTFSLPLSHTSSNPKSHSSQMHLASGSRLLGKDKYFAKEQSERRRLRKKSRPGVVNEDDFLELEEGAIPRAPGVAYAGRGYLPNLSGSRSSIDDAASVDSRNPADALHSPPSSDIRPSAGGLLSTAALLALEGRDSAAESSAGSANVEKPAGVGPPMAGRSAFLTRIGSLKRWAGAGVGRKRGQERERDASNFGSGGANPLVDSLGPGVGCSSSPPAESSPLRKASRERFSKLSGFLPLGLHHSPSSQQQHSPLPSTQSLTNSASSGTRSRSLSAAPGTPNPIPPVSHPDSSSGVSKSAGARLTSHVHQAGSPPPLPPRVPSSPTSSRFPALKEKRTSALPTVQSGQALNTLLGEEIDRSDTPRARVPELLTKRLMTSATSGSISSPSTPKANPKHRFGPFSSSRSGSRNEGTPSGVPVVTQPTKLQLQTALLNSSRSNGSRSGVGSRKGTPNASPATEQSPHNTPWSASEATSPASTNPNSRRSSAVFPGVVAIPISGSGSYRYAPKRESVNSPLSSSPPFTFSIPSSESSYVPASSTSTNPSTSSGANTSNTSFSRDSVDEPRVSPTRDQVPRSKPFLPPIELRSPSPINVTNILRRDVDLTSGDGSNQSTPVQRRGDLPGSPSLSARKAASGNRNRSNLTDLGLGITPAGVTGEKKDKDKDAIPSSFKWKDGELTEDGVVDREHMVQNSLGTMRTAKQASYRRLASSSATTIKQHQNQEHTVADIALASTKQTSDIPLAPSQPPAVDPPSASRGFVVGKSPSPEEISESSVGSLVAGRSEISSGAGSKGRHAELKIPARITQQQHALKRDLNAVREFASCVGDLKRLQDVYRQRLGALRLAIQEKASSHLSRPAAAEVRNNKRPSHAPRRSGDFRIPRWGRASPGPVFATARTSLERTDGQYAHILTSFQTLDATFGIWWECADLLVELSATGKEDGAASTNHSSVSSAAPSAANSPDRMKYHSPLPVTATGPALVNNDPSEESSRAMRERAVTLVGLEKPALGNGETSASRASTTGRHDLNPRQLALLKEMLNLQDPSTFPLPQSPPELPSNSAEPRYNYSHSKSAITLLSVEESGQSRSQSPLPPENADKQETPIREKKPKRLSRRGILGVRDLLLSIKRSRDTETALRQQFKEKQTPSPLPKSPPLPRLHSSSDDLVPTCGAPHRRRKKISTDPVAQDAVSPIPVLKHDAPRTDPGKWGKTNTIASGPDRLSPRRPSLSALFRLGHSPRINGGRNSSKSRSGEHHAEDTGSVSISPAVAARDVVDEDGEEWDRMELEQLERNIPSVANGYQDDATSRASRSLGLQSGALVTAGLGMGLVSGGALKRRKRDSAPPQKTTAQTDLSTSSLSLGMASNASKDDALDATTKSPSNKLRRKLSDSKVKPHGGSRQLSPLAQVVSPHAIGYAQPRAPRSLSRDLSAASASSVNLPQSSQSAILQSPTTQEQLALTPQNLVPLLKYAKEVRTRLKECLEELTGIENEFIRIDPRPRNPRQELEVNTKDTIADANAVLVGKGYDPDSSLDSVEDMDAMGGLGQSV